MNKLSADVSPSWVWHASVYYATEFGGDVCSDKVLGSSRSALGCETSFAWQAVLMCRVEQELRAAATSMKLSIVELCIVFTQHWHFWKTHC